MRRAQWSIMFVVSVLGAALTGCLPGRVVRIDATSDGKTVPVPLNGTLIVELDSNRTTGYAWALEAVDASILRFKDSEYVAPTTTLVGAGGKESWRFDAIAAGQTLLKLNYERSFEPEEEPADTFEVTVTVE